jgi:putative photosynthetic complex assembly protein
MRFRRMADEARRPGEIRVPPALLWSAAALIVLTFASIIVARETGHGMLRTAAIAEKQERELVFRAGPDGGMVVLTQGGRLLDRLVVEGDSFAMTAVRAVGSGDPAETEYHVVVHRGPGGGLQLEDPATGRRLTLAGFGPDNAGVFESWLDAPIR